MFRGSGGGVGGNSSNLLLWWRIYTSSEIFRLLFKLVLRIYVHFKQATSMCGISLHRWQDQRACAGFCDLSQITRWLHPLPRTHTNKPLAFGTCRKSYADYPLPPTQTQTNQVVCVCDGWGMCGAMNRKPLWLAVWGKIYLFLSYGGENSEPHDISETSVGRPLPTRQSEVAFAWTKFRNSNSTSSNLKTPLLVLGLGWTGHR